MASDDGSRTTLGNNEDEDHDDKSVARLSPTSSTSSSPIGCGQSRELLKLNGSSPTSAGCSNEIGNASLMHLSQTSVLTTLAMAACSTTPSPASQTLLTLSQDSQTLRYDMSQMESDVALVLSQQLPKAEVAIAPNDPQDAPNDDGDSTHELGQDDKDSEPGQDEEDIDPHRDQSSEHSTDRNYVELRDDDILTGRGTGTMKRPGNIYFRLLVRETSAAFHAASSKKRRRLANELVSKVENAVPPRRFVEQLDGSDRYAILDTDRVLSKVLQALRKSTPLSSHDSQAPEEEPIDTSTNERLGTGAEPDNCESQTEQTSNSDAEKESRKTPPATPDRTQEEERGYKIVEITSGGSLGIEIKPSADKRHCYVSRVHRGMSAERAGITVGNVFVDPATGEVLDQHGVTTLARSRPFVVGLLPSNAAAESKLAGSRKRKRNQSNTSEGRPAKKQQKSLELSQWKKADGTYGFDESVDMLELVQSNCDGCNHGVADGHRHHLGCPKNQVGGRTLSPASLERMKEGAKIGCPTCIFELETGVRCTIPHHDECPRTRKSPAGKRKLPTSSTETKSRKAIKLSKDNALAYQRSDGTYHIDDDQDLGDVIASFCKVCNGTATSKGSHHAYCSTGSEVVESVAVKKMVDGVNAGCSKCIRELTTGTKRPGTHTLSCPRRPGWVKPPAATCQDESSPASPASIATRSSEGTHDEVRSQGRRRRPLPTPALRFVSVSGDDIFKIDESFNVFDVFTALCWACSGDLSCEEVPHHFYCPRNPSHRHSPELLEAMVSGVNAGCTRCTRELRCGKISGGSHTSGCPRRGARGKKLKASPDGKRACSKGKIRTPASPEEKPPVGDSKDAHSSLSDVAEVSTALLEISKQPILRPVEDVSTRVNSNSGENSSTTDCDHIPHSSGDPAPSTNNEIQEKQSEVASLIGQEKTVGRHAVASEEAHSCWEAEESHPGQILPQGSCHVTQNSNFDASKRDVDENREKQSSVTKLHSGSIDDKGSMEQRHQSQGSEDRLSHLVDQLESLQSESESAEELSGDKKDVHNVVHGDSEGVRDGYVLSEYERERINRIKRNEERLATLGLVQLKDNMNRGIVRRSKRDWKDLITTAPRQTRSRTVTPVSAPPAGHATWTSADLMTRLLDESIPVETVQVSFCKACKRVAGTKKARAHHTLCPQHPHFNNSGASEKLKQARRSANLGCAQCLHLLHHGTVVDAPDHSLDCEKHPEHQSQQTPVSLEPIAKQPPSPQLPSSLPLASSRPVPTHVTDSPIKPAATPTVAPGQSAATLPVHSRATGDIAIRPVWRSCPNPWGSFVPEARDVILRAGFVGQQHPETLFPGNRFIEIPFASDSSYRETHSQPPHLLNLRLTRDPVSTNPWGFTFANHEFGGACLVQAVDPASPAGNAVLEGTSIIVPLRQDDMIIAYDGNPVGGMTEMGLEVELECCGAELQLVIARCNLGCNRATPSHNLNEMLSNSRQLHWAEINTEDSETNATTVEKQWPQKSQAVKCSIGPDRLSSVAEKLRAQRADAVDTHDDQRNGKLAINKTKKTAQPFKAKQSKGNKGKDSAKTEEAAWDEDDNVCAGCVCGKIHRNPTPVFWLQCDVCQSWYNVADNCVKLTEDEAQDLKRWCCWACEPSPEDDEGEVHEKAEASMVQQGTQSSNGQSRSTPILSADVAAASKTVRTVQAAW